MIVIIDLMGDEEIITEGKTEVETKARDEEKAWREIMERMPQPDVVPVIYPAANHSLAIPTTIKN
jgi:hypothetical protein